MAHDVREVTWTGGQIIDHHAAMQAAIRPPTPLPAGLTAAHKIQKQKLRPPAKQRESA